MPAPVDCSVACFARLSQLIAGHAVLWFEPPAPHQLEDCFVSIESPSSEVARVALEGALRSFAARLAARIHANFHVRFSSVCAGAFSAREMPQRRPGEDLTVKDTLAEWAAQFRLDFREAHNSSAHRARRALEASATGVASIDQLSRDIGVGRRTLERRFREEIGISLTGYRTCLRLAYAVLNLYSGDACVESVALNAGWSTKKGLYGPFQERAGMTPTDVRRLSAEQKNVLAASLVICGRGAVRCSYCRGRASKVCPDSYSLDASPIFPARQPRRLPRIECGRT